MGSDEEEDHDLDTLRDAKEADQPTTAAAAAVPADEDEEEEEEDDEDDEDDEEDDDVVCAALNLLVVGAGFWGSADRDFPCDYHSPNASAVAD